jgi:hypothetical protein
LAPRPGAGCLRHLAGITRQASSLWSEPRTAHRFAAEGSLKRLGTDHIERRFAPRLAELGIGAADIRRRGPG